MKALGQSVQQLAERPARAGGEGVVIRGEGGNQESAGLQHRHVSVFLHNPTDLSQQQVQVLADRERDSKISWSFDFILHILWMWICLRHNLIFLTDNRHSTFNPQRLNVCYLLHPWNSAVHLQVKVKWGSEKESHFLCVSRVLQV